MNPWLAFLIGADVGCMCCCAAIFLGNRRGRRRLEKQRELLDAMKAAERASGEAAKRGDLEAFELHDAEFWALSAELSLALGVQQEEK